MRRAGHKIGGTKWRGQKISGQMGVNHTVCGLGCGRADPMGGVQDVVTIQRKAADIADLRIKGQVRRPGLNPQPALQGQPLNPVATTNFSELSERDAGGLTCTTFSNFCLSSFCKSPSAPPAKTLATNVPPGSKTSKAK